jgi:hypothetical protein
MYLATGSCKILNPSSIRSRSIVKILEVLPMRKTVFSSTSLTPMVVLIASAVWDKVSNEWELLVSNICKDRDAPEKFPALIAS